MQREESLYEKLGGYDGIAEVIDDFIGRIVTDKQLGRFFVGHSTDSKKRIRQLIIEFVCNATEGSCNYIGRDLYTAHVGLGITENDWELGVKYLEEALDEFHVSDKEKKIVLETVSGIKEDIVEE